MPKTPHMLRSPYFSDARRARRAGGQPPQLATAIAKRRAPKAARLPEPSIEQHARWFGCLSNADGGERHRAFFARWMIERGRDAMHATQKEEANREFEQAARAYDAFRAQRWRQIRTGSLSPIDFEVHRLRCLPLDALIARLDELERDPPTPTAPSAENVNTAAINDAVHASRSLEGTRAWWKVVVDAIREERRAELGGGAHDR